jgi:hypothetical protein
MGGNPNEVTNSEYLPAPTGGTGPQAAPAWDNSYSRSQKSGAGMVGECIGVAYVARQNVDALVPADRTHLEN